MARRQALPTVLTVLALSASAWSQMDDFDIGNADDWELSDVLSQVGGQPAEITFPDGNSIRLQSSPSPDPEALGPSRVGFFREDVIYTDVTVLMDMVAWDPNLAQDFGIIARGQTIGLGTTSGYALTVDVDEQTIYLSRLDNEVADVVSPGEELVQLESEDEGYANGSNGFFTNSGVADGSTDATFDRFIAFDPSGPSAPPQVAVFDLTNEMVSMDYTVPIQAGGDYVLETSADLQAWSILETGNVPIGFTQGSFRVADAAAQARFYRVNQAPPLFSESFEGGAEGWTTEVIAGETSWELGTPDSPELMAARSGTQAYGTLLDQRFTDNAVTWLRSPVIDFTGKRRPTLAFWYHVDVTEGEEGVLVNYLDESGNVIGSHDEIFWTKTAGWTAFETDLPEVVLDKKIMIEWLFRSNDSSPNGAGFFLDDVVVD